MPLQKKVFTKGLDSDHAQEFIQEGYDRYRLNVRVMASEGSDLGVIETMNGNTLVTFTLPSGTNTCIGSKEYLLHKKSYHFIYNTTLANHSILEYDHVTNTITKVLQNQYLKFSLTHLITGINIIELDQDNHLLYWTDYNVEPRKINIEKAKYHTAGNYTLGYPAIFSEEYLYRAKRPMPLSPVTNYSTDATRYINRLEKNLFQFKIQNVFDDKEVSAWSPISKTVFPNSMWPYDNNLIIIMVQTGSSIVKKIRIAVKEVREVDFKLVTEIDKEKLGWADNGTYAYFFYNDGNYPVLEERESIKLFDNVPRLSQSQDLIYGNRILDGLITEGFNPVDIDLKLGLTLSTSTVPGSSIIGAIVVTPGSGYGFAGGIAIISGDGTGATANVESLGGQVTNIYITNAGSGYTYATVSIFGSGGTGAAATLVLSPSTAIPINARKRGTDYIDGVIYYDNFNRSGTTNINEGRFDRIQNNGNYGTKLFIPFYTEPNSSQVSLTYNTLTGGVFLPGDAVMSLENTGTGIVVSDSGTGLTIGTIAGDWNFTTTVGQSSGPVYAYVSSVGESAYGGSYPIIDWTLFNEPPSWATHYQFARTKKSNAGRFLQFSAKLITYLDKNGATVSPYNSAAATQMKIDISNITGSYATANPGSLLVYDFVKGDRIRFIRNSTGAAFNEYIDFEVALYEVASMEVRVRFPIGYVPINFTNGDIFEIYNLSLTVPDTGRLTYEFGAGGDITFDSQRGHYIHNGTTSNQIINTFNGGTTYVGATMVLQLNTGHGLLASDEVKVSGSGWSVYGIVASSGPVSATITTTTTLNGIFSASGGGTISKGAKGAFSGGDTFYRVREMQSNSGGVSALIEDANYSDLFISPGYDYGRPNRIDPEYREIVRPSTAYWSESFVPETNINGLSSVYEDSFETYEAKYGGIYKLFAEDQRVTIFQELKIGQVPIESIIINTSTGSSMIGQSQDVLSPSVIYYQADFGIGKHPESFATYNKAKYGIDVLRGVIWRLSLDGVIPISDLASMHNFTTDQCKLVLASPNKINIYGQYDIRFGEYIISFSEISRESPAVTLAFNEKTNMFSTFYSYTPEMMCSNGIDIISFKDGALYTHNTNAIQANFYGGQYQPEIWAVMNEAPSNEKILEAISEETNSAWEVYDISTPNGQQSNLIVADFEEKNNLQYAPMWFDTNTPNVTNPLSQGDVLIDTTFLAKLRYTLTTPTRIFCVNFKYIISNLSNR